MAILKYTDTKPSPQGFICPRGTHEVVRSDTPPSLIEPSTGLDELVFLCRQVRVGAQQTPVFFHLFAGEESGRAPRKSTADSPRCAYPRKKSLPGQTPEEPTWHGSRRDCDRAGRQHRGNMCIVRVVILWGHQGPQYACRSSHAPTFCVPEGARLTASVTVLRHIK